VCQLISEKILLGPVVIDGDVVRLIKLPDGSGRMEVLKPASGGKPGQGEAGLRHRGQTHSIAEGAARFVQEPGLGDRITFI
jgi:hypothetical protein